MGWGGFRFGFHRELLVEKIEKEKNYASFFFSIHIYKKEAHNIGAQGKDNFHILYNV